MLLEFILLQARSASTDLVLAIAMCIVPFVLGWLAAMVYYKVNHLRDEVKRLTAEVGDLNSRNATLNADLTNTRVTLTQREAELEQKNETLARLRNQLTIAEADLNVAKFKLQEIEEGGGKGSGKGGGKDSGGKGSGAGNGEGAAAATTTYAAASGPIPFAGGRFKQDDLEIVEGIGPKIAELLRDAGINTWKQLSETEVERIQQVLDAAGPRFNIADPGTWAEQARLASAGDWDGLQSLQDQLKGGR